MGAAGKVCSSWALIRRLLRTRDRMSVTAQIARRAGELLGATGLSGHRCAIDAVVAATVLGLERPIVLLTSDPDDMNRLVEEPDRPKAERIVVVRV
jgi:predicted nucleic acid-binding protein